MDCYYQHPEPCSDRSVCHCRTPSPLFNLCCITLLNVNTMTGYTISNYTQLTLKASNGSQWLSLSPLCCKLQSKRWLTNDTGGKGSHWTAVWKEFLFLYISLLHFNMFTGTWVDELVNVFRSADIILRFNKAGACAGCRSIVSAFEEPLRSFLYDMKGLKPTPTENTTDRENTTHYRQRERGRGGGKGERGRWGRRGNRKIK